MGFAPLTHALDVGRASEVVAISRLAQPAAVTFGIAGSATLRFGAEPLMPSVAKVGIKQLFTMQALTLIRAGHPR